MFEIIDAATADDIAKIKLLFEEYAVSLNFDLCFQNFDNELKNLPGEYSPPNGCLLLAVDNNESVGCVALRKLEDGICEMKRLYVKEKYRNQNIGKALVESVIEKAKPMNYKKMRLDTVPSMQKAQKLYRLKGFYEIKPYRENPINGAVYMELIL